jgi:fatty-acyl-CoA synthase
MQGLMQDVPLTIDLILRRAVEQGHKLHVASAGADGVRRLAWSEVGDRALRLADVLDRLGASSGARVGTFAWNTHRHLELYYGVPCSGRVLHSANVRLHADQVRYAIDHAGDEVLFVDASLTPTIALLRDRLGVRTYVVMDDGAPVDDAFADCPTYEELLAEAEPVEALPELSESSAASVCFTSGTTGRPKAVVYSHRSVVLHAMGALMVDSHAIRRGDVVLPLTPMFHVNCWGLPYSSALAPASLVLAGSDTSPVAVARLIESERATVVAGIPTFWVQMDGVFASGEFDLSSVRRILCGGAEAPPSLVARYLERGIDFLHAWGMTEMSPSGTANWLAAGGGVDDAGPGWPVPGVALRLVDAAGETLPWDGRSVGELEARGPWVARAYHEPDDDANESRFHDGWLRTGDVARIRPDGSLELVDREKDLVKSGGEWISSLDLERVLVSHPDVAEAAVIAVPNERWGERPAALVVPAKDVRPDPGELREFLARSVASWWLPEVIELVADLPKTAVGKYDKRRLREEHAARLATVLESARTPTPIEQGATR